jgi:dUTP pyrophosphatase
MNQLKFKKLHHDAIIPTRANLTDAGLDIYALKDVLIPASEVNEFRWRKASDIENVAIKGIHNGIQKELNLHHLPVQIGQTRIPTGIAVEIPEGHYGKVSSRSGLAFKSGIFSFDGTVDSGYRSEIGVLLYNTTSKPYQVRKGDRIAQLIVVPCAIMDPLEVDELSPADRGENGFGSSGR